MNVIGPQISLLLLFSIITIISIEFYHLIQYFFLFDFSRWEDFSRPMQDMLRHSDHKGFEVKKPSGSLYTFPMPDCMCKLAEARSVSSNATRLA